MIPILLLIAYWAFLIKVMVFKDLPVIRIGHLRFNMGGTHVGPANFIPFDSIMPYLRGQRGSLIGAINIIGNILLLVPVGFLLPFINQKLRWKKIPIFAIASGLAIEIMQVIFQVGIFDVDDIILNSLGVSLGFAIFCITRKNISN